MSRGSGDSHGEAGKDGHGAVVLGSTQQPQVPEGWPPGRVATGGEKVAVEVGVGEGEGSRGYLGGAGLRGSSPEVKVATGEGGHGQQS